MKTDEKLESSYLKEFQTYIQNSEYTLISFMYSQGTWKGMLPNPPANYSEKNSNIELGLAAYWMNHYKVLKFASQIKQEIRVVIDLWYYTYGSTFPKTLMDSTNYDFINSDDNHMIYTDGSVLNAHQYATFDQNWFLAFLNLVETFLRSLWKFGISGANYPANSTPIPISGKRNPDEVTIAVVGDWGTGDTVAQQVMNHIKAYDPDYIIHLGDVYYSGTPTVGRHFFSLGEEQKNLLNIWPSEFKDRSFTLNSNHEMYTGAHGYFDVALATDTPFSAQKGQGCFALKFGDWTILGLDSGYFGSSTDAFMQGSIGEEGTPQRKWIKSLNLDAGKTIVMTHHTGVADDCSAVNNLWTQVHLALGNKDPYAWYWGHVHNAIVYKSPLIIKPSGHPTFTSNTFTRCCGHGALPYGNATDLDKISQIRWREKGVNPITNLLPNGFALITMKKRNNTVNSIQESFLNVSRGTTFYNQLYPPHTSSEQNEHRSEEFNHVVKGEVNSELYHAIQKYLGSSVHNKDASLVACSDESELKTVKNNFLIKKLGLKESPELDQVIQNVCEQLGSSNRHKKRIEFYYLLTIHFDKESVFV